MKTLFFILSFCIISQFSVAQDAATIVSWDKNSIELGKVKKGEKREGSFTLTNVADEIVSIEIVDACECTTLEYSTEDIAPGEQSTISFVFDSSEKDESETIDVDVTFKNENPKTGGPYMVFLSYSYELEL